MRTNTPACKNVLATCNACAHYTMDTSSSTLSSRNAKSSHHLKILCRKPRTWGVVIITCHDDRQLVNFTIACLLLGRIRRGIPGQAGKQSDNLCYLIYG